MTYSLRTLFIAFIGASLYVGSIARHSFPLLVVSEAVIIWAIFDWFSGKHKMRVIETKHGKVKFDDSDEVIRKTFERIVEFVGETGLSSGESIMQSDTGHIDGLQALVDIVDEIKFEDEE
jgi:hypothetical protein